MLSKEVIKRRRESSSNLYLNRCSDRQQTKELFWLESFWHKSLEIYKLEISGLKKDEFFFSLSFVKVRDSSSNIVFLLFILLQKYLKIK